MEMRKAKATKRTPKRAIRAALGDLDDRLEDVAAMLDHVGRALERAADALEALGPTGAAPDGDSAAPGRDATPYALVVPGNPAASRPLSAQEVPLFARRALGDLPEDAALVLDEAPAATASEA